MGNCQAVDAAALVIQHPSGRIERMYWAISASMVMKLNPGHYVSLIIPLPNISGDVKTDEKTVKFTRVKLLRPSDTLVLGRAYRLVTSQEVMKVLREKKYGKIKKNQIESDEKAGLYAEKQSSNSEAEGGKSELEETIQAMKQERHGQRERHRQTIGSINFAAARSRSWRPSLQSISESGS